ncbi:hypothetical protein LCGC14_1709020, partial [marine sediment metagenome]
PFAGRTGRELDGLYLPIAGIPRREVFVSNASKCPRKNFDNPTKQEAQACSEYHLPSEIRECQPEVIVPMGAVACSLFGDQMQLESQHGIPFQGELYGWQGWVFPTYHPAIGLHEGSWMQVMMDDFQGLKTFLEGFQSWESDQYPSPDYREIRSMRELNATLEDAHSRELLSTCAIDTEATPLSYYGSVTQRWKPYCLSYSFRPGTGYTIYLDNPAVVEEFIRRMWQLDPLWIIHNYLFDKDILDAIGIRVRRFDDTMIRAYNLQRIPKGLKPLAFRLCGMRMQDFDDVVTPHSMDVVLDWVSNAATSLRDIMHNPHGKPTAKHPKGKLLKKPRKLPEYSAEQSRSLSKLDKIIYDWGDCDPWQRWRDWHDHDRRFISEYFGPMPRQSIAHCPRSQVTPYASADADGAIRILPKLKHLARDLRQSVTVY